MLQTDGFDRPGAPPVTGAPGGGSARVRAGSLTAERRLTMGGVPPGRGAHYGPQARRVRAAGWHHATGRGPAWRGRHNRRYPAGARGDRAPRAHDSEGVVRLRAVPGPRGGGPGRAPGFGARRRGERYLGFGERSRGARSRPGAGPRVRPIPTEGSPARERSLVRSSPEPGQASGRCTSRSVTLSTARLWGLVNDDARSRFRLAGRTGAVRVRHGILALAHRSDRPGPCKAE